ncbi:Mobile element protein [Candidatus Burkholderia humilis]|nr:Mobile element protein [Candidatus Burkholderia humilis]
MDLLWSEYKAQEPEGYGYSWFCKHYERWAAALPVTLRQVHVPGEKLFIDYSSNKLGIVDPNTGEIRETELFVATLGASNYTPLAEGRACPGAETALTMPPWRVSSVP